MWDLGGNGDGGMGKEMEGVVEMDGCAMEGGSWPHKIFLIKTKNINIQTLNG